MIRQTTVTEIIVTLNIMLFLYTGIAKIIDYSVFREQLADSPILSWGATTIALLLPWFEFAIVLMLLIPRWRLKGLYSSLGLMSLFTLYIITLFSISTEMPCNCGGIIELLSWKQHLIFNGVFIILNGWAIYHQKKRIKEFNNGWNTRKEHIIS